MDSSRSGFFSTLLMTLPLIIVPAMALLRPPHPSASVSSRNLAADEVGNDVTELGFPDDFSGKTSPDSVSENSDDVDINAIFGTAEKGTRNGTDAASGKAPKTSEGDVVQSDNDVPSADFDPFQDSDSGAGRSPTKTRGGDAAKAPAPQASGDGRPRTAAPTGPADPIESDRSSAQRLVQQLNALGSIRTLWFDAGDRTPVGFAAFFRGQTELTVYRFEAVGQTRAECARNVLDQVTAWRRQTATAP
ncbi:MAG: hypothetical protein ACKO2L_03580 [Planctomycetaceae bacterium]